MPSPSTGTTQVSLSATVSILGQTVTVNTGPGNFVFQLSQPVVLGSIDNFIDSFLNGQLGLPVHSSDLTAIGNLIPIKALKDAFETIQSSPISITVLYINYNAGQYAFGVSMTFNNPIGILGALEFQGVGINVANTTLGSP
jgi:hypothetical protein